MTEITKIAAVSFKQKNAVSNPKEKNKTPDDKTRSSKYLTGLCTLGAMAAVTIGGILAKKYLDMHKVQKSAETVKREIEEQSRKIMEKQAQKQAADLDALRAKRAAEEARQAEETRTVRITCNQETKPVNHTSEKVMPAQHVENEAQSARTAITSETDNAERLHSQTTEKLNAIVDKFKSETDGNVSFEELSKNFRKLYGESTTTGITDKISKVLVEAESKGDNINVGELKKILQDLSVPEENIINMKKTISQAREKDGVLYQEARELVSDDSEENILRAIDSLLYGSTLYVRKLESRNKYISNILDTMQRNPKSSTQQTSEYFSEIIGKSFEEERTRLKQFEETIKSKLSYQDGSIAENIPDITPEQKQILCDELNKIMYDGKPHFTVDTDIKELAHAWKTKYISGYTPELPKDVETSLLLNEFEHASPDKYYQDVRFKPDIPFEHIPLCRWLKISDTENFLKQFEKEGGEYSYNRLQSCSVNYHQGEPVTGSFGDNSSKYTVKFIIHPKNSTSHGAARLGAGKYGDCEAIYPSGQKFKYLGKYNRQVPAGESMSETFYRWEIHLQEI